ncbi:MAG: lytic murein transglycosylase B [Gammaproteobacteria bacterium]|nr:lytic murein transglycosylase B [Gammaproteobacteria bacterium]MBQ0841058.1 lytic murein transglycosylase B [Gammaproteobacteria bacterium]
MFKTGLASLLITLLASAAVVRAEADRNYGGNAQAQAFIERMVVEHGADRAELQTLFGGAQYKQSIIDAMTRPAEKVKLWKDYRKIFVTDKRIRQGLAFWREQQQWLEKMQADYGVPIEYVVAIIGVETYYGRIAGNYRVIDALSTLAFDYPARSPFFTKELEHFLLLAKEQKLDAATLKGSYAGAMGYGQFMPSSYRAYAVDYNADGVADIWADPVDAIGSVANYFVKHGWQPGEGVVVRARIRADYSSEGINKLVKPTLNLAQLAAQGFSPVLEMDAQVKAIPLRLQGQAGVEFWLGLQNYYTITRYNHSFRYAMAVTQLAEQIAAGMNSGG